MSEHKIRVGITHGDPNGIGYEVIIKSLADSRMCEMCTPVIYGSSKAVAYYRNNIEGAENFVPTVVSSARDARNKQVSIINCVGDDMKVEPGISTPEAGAAAVEALERAVADLKAGLIDVLVTAPINKENVQSEAFPFTGHTEFLAARFDARPTMIMCSELLRVGLATIHLPLAEVASKINKELIVEKLVQLRKTLISDFSIREPRIAVFSLNPHAGDGGLLGSEEKEIITPAIEEARAKGVLAFGPMPSDGFFAAGHFDRYDAVLCMYHDQGLAPFKALTPWGVNFASGLPVVRTSPDHGVAYDIAGENKADERSMREAIYTAIDIFRSREVYKQMSANPLRRFERDKGRDMSASDLPEEVHED